MNAPNRQHSLASLHYTYLIHILGTTI